MPIRVVHVQRGLLYFIPTVYLSSNILTGATPRRSLSPDTYQDRRIVRVTAPNFIPIISVQTVENSLLVARLQKNTWLESAFYIHNIVMNVYIGFNKSSCKLLYLDLAWHFHSQHTLPTQTLWWRVSFGVCGENVEQLPIQPVLLLFSRENTSRHDACALQYECFQSRNNNFPDWSHKVTCMGHERTPSRIL